MEAAPDLEGYGPTPIPARKEVILLYVNSLSSSGIASSHVCGSPSETTSILIKNISHGCRMHALVLKVKN
jgi:hypothetical protein